MPTDVPDTADYWWPRERQQQSQKRDTKCPLCHKMFCGEDGLRTHIKFKHKN